MEYPETHATTAMLKAMTHPLRRRILAVFPRLEYVRAADLATELGEPANKISFHLRVKSPMPACWSRRPSRPVTVATECGRR